MISWLQNTFQKHFRFVFFILMAVMTISLVSIYSASGGVGRGRDSIKPKQFFGIQITSDADIGIFDRDGEISLRLTAQGPINNMAQVRMHGLQRVAALHLADRYGVPEPSREQLKTYLERLPLFQGPDGQFNPEAYTRFKDSLQFSRVLDEALVARVMKEDWRISHIGRAMGGPGYVLDSEVGQSLSLVDTRWSLETAALDLSKVPAPEEPSEEQIRLWFSTRSYQTPERMRVSYVEYRAADFQERVKLTDEQIVQFFEQNRARYRKPAPPSEDGTPALPAGEPTLEDVRAEVVADATLARARNLAAQAAADLAYVLFDKQIKRDTPAFETLVAQQKLALMSPPPFTAQTPPPGLPWSSTVLAEAFRLNDKRPVSDPLPTSDGAVLLFFDERIPSGPAELPDVRDRVVAELRNDLRQRAIQAEGAAVRSRLVEALQSGKTLTEAAQAAGLETKAWTGFTSRTLPDDLDRSLLAGLTEMPVRELSPMITQGSRGTFVLVTERQEPALESMGEQFDEMRGMLMRQNSMVLSSSILAGIAADEMIASGLARDNE